ncbi:MAG: hypothetical protein KAH10_08735 [Flavobacteriales bacterium]|nr:hypothetical protein [Flavobacteriales bacterium]
MAEELNSGNNTPPQKSYEKAEKDHKLKTLVWLFGALLVASIAYIAYSFNENKENQEYLMQQKQEIVGELARMEHQYDGVTLDNDSLNTKLLEQQERISGLRDSVDRMKAYPYLLRKYKKLVETMKKEKRQLFLLADSLDRMNQILVTQRDDAEQKLQEQTIMSEKLADQNVELAKKVEQSAVIELFNLKAEGVKVSSSGKIRPTSRARRTDKVRVCMTIGRNKLTEVGDKTIFVRIATPSNALLGSNLGNTFTVGGESMNYSAKTSIYYEQDALDVCVFVDGFGEEFTKGVYLVAVYADDKFIGETELLLK